jgi:hypothetical protein
MSRSTFIVGLIISVALHVWLMRIPAGPVALPLPTMIVPVVETELAQLDEPDPSIPEPAPDPIPEPVAKQPPAPEPEPPVEEPLPELTRVAEAPPTQTPEPGDFAGATNAKGPPELRIDWGTGDQALDTLDAGNMILVVLDREGGNVVIGQKVVYDAGVWRRRPYQPVGATQYSNRLRIVDQVPAFGGANAAVNLRGEERLAVLLPMRVERTLASAQMEAAYNNGLVMNEIDNFAGRFTLRDGALAFDITHIGASERNAAQ